MHQSKRFYLSTARPSALRRCSPGQPGGAQGTVAIDNDDIGGVVTGPKGPEAGVWVIAETDDLPTRYAKMVVTDDQGRYVVPDLPKGKYKVWVRGYGLVNSPKVDGEPGKQLNLTAVPAPNDAAAAQYYPAIYWYSMLKIPDAGPVRRQERHPREGQADRLAQPDEEQRLRRLPSARPAGDAHDSGGVRHGSSKDAWMHRIQSGQAGELMVNIVAGQLSAAPLAYFADWTDRVAKGELPHAKPKRPQASSATSSSRPGTGQIEKQYLHDLLSTDKRNPTVNANGPVYGRPNTAWTPCRSSIRRRTRRPSTRRRSAIRTCRDARPGPRRHGQAARSFGLLGRRRRSGRALQQPQLDVRRQGPRLADRGVPRPAQRASLLQEGLGSSVSQAVPARAEHAGC